ncbi:flagellar protein FliS [Sporosarcina luteola]|uniref:flagellar export chaperone FliS n=1 Tax=Sporosarcina luteola TaxID=582850 RepID=UPI00203E87B4|nr:flagellar export chaperone FliS [Sporosarcina luteola]MCM3636839.1 flagellar protein FliS [Sporosarcina luteola]
MTTIDIEKAIQIYKEASASTLSMMEYVLLLLNELQKNIQQCKQAIEVGDTAERNRTLRKAQDFLFELMTTTDHEAERSDRLMVIYLHMNQCLVQTQMTKTDEQLDHLEEMTVQLIASWQVAKQVTRRRNFTTDRL